jgi:hypothetical protein
MTVRISTARGTDPVSLPVNAIATRFNMLPVAFMLEALTMPELLLLQLMLKSEKYFMDVA